MAWTAPMTAVANATFTAAQWNTNVRDNMLQTEAAKATTHGRYFATTAANTIAERSWYVNYKNTSQSTTSTTYASLASGGPSIAVTTDANCIVFFTAAMGSTTAGASAWASVEVSGATTVAASDTWAIMVDGMAATTSTDNMCRFAGFHRFSGLTPGTNTFNMLYRVSAGTGWFTNRAISVMAF